MVYNSAFLQEADIVLFKTHHRISVEVYILDTSRRWLHNMTDSLVSGAVDIDVEGETTRFGKMALLDPQQRLSLDLNGVGWGSNMSNRLVQIVYRVSAMDWSRSYACPIFTGPITDASRDGAILNIEFKGMEYFMQGGVLVDSSLPAGWFRSQYITYMALGSGLVGAADYSGGGGVMYSPWAFEAGDNLWSRCKELAASGGFNIFFNGDGVLQLRPKTRDPVIVLDTTWLTEEPQFNLDISKLRNLVRVEGANIPGTDIMMSYEAWPPASHPFSPQSLAVNGVNRLIPHLIKDSSLATWADIINTAWNNLHWDLLVAQTDTAVVPVIPFLEEYDVITLSHPKLWSSSPLSKATIPLVGDAEMSLNMFTTTSSGATTGGKVVSNKGQNGERLRNHGRSGAFNTLRGPLGNRGQDWYTGDDGGKGAPSKGKKKKNRKNKKGGK